MFRIVAYFPTNAAGPFAEDFPLATVSTGTDLPDRAEIETDYPTTRNQYVAALFSYGANAVHVTKED
jgi:hypothetical protein